MALMRANTGSLRRLAGRRTPASHPAIDGITILSPEAAWALYDREAQEKLGLTAEEFERAWKRGDFKTRQEDSGVRQVLMIRTAKP